MGWFGSLSSEIVAVLITLAVTIFWNVAREWFENRRQKRRVAAMLLSEVLNQSAFVIHFGSAVNFLMANKTWSQRAELVRMLPVEPIIYPAMIAQLPVLGPSVASGVISFYDSVARTASFASQLPDDPATDPMIRVRLQELELGSKFSASLGHSIIGDLSKLAGTEMAPNVPTILEHLADVYKGRFPTMDDGRSS